MKYVFIVSGLPSSVVSITRYELPLNTLASKHAMLSFYSVPTLFDFSRFMGWAPGKKDTLNFEAGEEIDVLATNDPEWWEGRSKKTGKTGFFPRNHVEVAEDRSRKPQVCFPHRDFYSVFVLLVRVMFVVLL